MKPSVASVDEWMSIHSEYPLDKFKRQNILSLYSRRGQWKRSEI